MIASLFSQYKGGGTSKLKDNVGRRTYGLFIYTPQGRMWAENLGEVSDDQSYEVLEQPSRIGGQKSYFWYRAWSVLKLQDLRDNLQYWQHGYDD